MSGTGLAKTVAAAVFLVTWLSLLAGTAAFSAGVVSAAAFLAMGLWKPRFALGTLVAFAAVTPLFSAIFQVPWFSPAEGGLLALWLAVALRDAKSPARPLDLAGTFVLLFGLYVALAVAALFFRYKYSSWTLGLSLAMHPLGDLLQLRQALPFYGFRGGTLLLEGMIAFLLARRIDAEPGEGRATLWGLWAGGCAAALSYFVFWLPRLFDPAHNWLKFRAPLTLQDPNSASSFGFLVLGAGIALAARRLKYWFVFPLPGLAVLFLGGSRAAYAIALLGCGGALCWLLWARRAEKKSGGRPGEADGQRAALGPVLMVFALLLLAAAFMFVKEGRFRQLANGEAFKQEHFAGRLGFWRAASRMVAAYPVSGVGAGELPSAMPLYLKGIGTPVYSVHENAHCYPLQLAAEYGVPLLLLWAGLLWVILSPRLRQWRVLSPEAAGLLLGTLFYLLHSLQSHPLLLAEQQILFWAALGGLAGHFSRLAEPGGSKPFRWAFMLLLLAPLWSVTQAAPAAGAARAYGFHGTEQRANGYEWRWSGSESWLMASVPGEWIIKIGIPRPDLQENHPRLLVESHGLSILDRRFDSPDMQEIKVNIPPGSKGLLLHFSVEPPFVPKEWQDSQDKRALGAWTGIPEGLMAVPPESARTGGAAATVTVLASEIPVINEESRKASCIVADTPSRVAAGSTFPVRMVFRNEGPGLWPADKLAATSKPLNASYHWAGLDGKEVVHDGRRALVNVAVGPGGTATITIEAVAPKNPGEYLFVPDLVEENVAWFGCVLPKGPHRVDVTP